MTDQPTPTPTAETPKTGMLAFLGTRMTKEVPFMGQKLKISKLSVAEVVKIQETAKDLENHNEAGLEMLRVVIAMSAENGSQLTDEHYRSFPMDELNKLSTAIMEFSGINQGSDADGTKGK
jgi:hypothetical protein